MTPAQELTDAELMTQFIRGQNEFRDRMREEWKAELLPLRQQITAVAQRTSRPPGTGPAGAAPSAPLLAADTNLRTWLANPGGQKAVFMATVPFTMEKKSQPITGVGGTIAAPMPLVGPMQPSLRLVEVLPQIQVTVGAAVQYAQETAYTPPSPLSSMIVPEGGTKPATDMTFAQTLASIITIATVTRVSIQSLNDVPSLQTWIDQRLAHGVMLAAEDHFLNAASPDGLLASAGSLSAGFAPGTGATTLDEIGAAISQLQSAGFTPDAVIMNGADAAKMKGLKNSLGDYLWASPSSALGTSSVWSTPLIISPAIAPGTWLVGAFAQSCMLFVRQQMSIEISFEDRDNFILNLATIRAEERCALAIAVPAGLIKGATLLAATDVQRNPVHPPAKK